MKKFSILFLMPIVVLALSGACKGDDGEDGLDGTNGTNGTNGAQGEPGTANVIYSEWQTITTSWKDSVIDADNVKIKHLVESKVTQDVIDGGVVLVYAKYDNFITPLPYTGNSSTYGVYTVSYVLRPGHIILSIFTHDDSGDVTWTTLLNYRYIIIPGGVVATAKKSTLDFTKLSYDEICTLFNISE